jgi:hypothetical protein
MSRNNRDDSLINFWTTCEIAVSAGARLRDEEAAHVMKKIFTGSWPEFSVQVDRFLHLRNLLLHEGISEVMWYDIHSGKQTFEYLLAILFDYAKRGRNLGRLCSIRNS